MTSPATPTSPSYALLHPLWLGSLAVLAINDHVLKGAGLLPDVITGKLSDFAGLIVAPVLLACLLRLRTRRGWWLAHAAVGVGFAAIQLSTVIATSWSHAMATVGFPWSITQDPTDLVALPALLVSACVFPAAMRARPRKTLRRSAELAAAGTGLLCCAATSPPPGEPFVGDIFPDVWLHNGTDSDVVVRLRAVKPSVDLDCEIVADNPGVLLTEPLFGDIQAWTLPPDRNLEIAGEFNEFFDPGGDTRGCNAVLVDIEGTLPAVFFWDEGAYERHSVSGEGFDEDDPSGIMLEANEDGDLFFTHDEDGIVHTLRPLPPPATGECAPQDDGRRLAWSDVPRGAHTLIGVDSGADGCLGLDLAAPGVDPETATGDRWYLCVPGSMFPFQVGDELNIDTVNTGASEGVRVLGTTPGAESEVWAYRGGLVPATHGVSFAPVPEFSCELRAEPECGTVARSAVLAAGGGDYEAAELAAGEKPRQLLGSAGNDAMVYVAHAQVRFALDPECAEGPSTIGDDIEAVVTIIPHE